MYAAYTLHNVQNAVPCRASHDYIWWIIAVIGRNILYRGVLKSTNDYRFVNSLISSETARHFQKHSGKLRWFCVFRSVLLDSDGLCKQKSWSSVTTQPPYGVRICCICASYPLHPRAMDDDIKCRDPHFLWCCRTIKQAWRTSNHWFCDSCNSCLLIPRSLQSTVLRFLYESYFYLPILLWAHSGNYIWFVLNHLLCLWSTEWSNFCSLPI